MENLKDVLILNNFNFKKQFGQNFISDTNLLKSIVSASNIDKNDTVIEIGCGAGTLTYEIAKVAKKVIGFEIDNNLKPVLAQTLYGIDNVEINFGDFLKYDITKIENGLDSYIVIANLPYYITTDIIERFLYKAKKVKRLIIMVQVEVAERLCAKENTENYRAITAELALKSKVEIIKKVHKTMFIPQPKVDSAVVKIEFIKGNIKVADEKTYIDTVHCVFLSRRKTLINNLCNYFKFSKETSEEILNTLNLPLSIRGEALSPETLAKLSDNIYTLLN